MFFIKLVNFMFLISWQGNFQTYEIATETSSVSLHWEMFDWYKYQFGILVLLF